MKKVSKERYIGVFEKVEEVKIEDKGKKKRKKLSFFQYLILEFIWILIFILLFL